MSTHPRVQQFGTEVWNAGDENLARLLMPDFIFRGSLGAPAHGHAEYLQIVRSVRGAFADRH